MTAGRSAAAIGAGTTVMPASAGVGAALTEARVKPAISTVVPTTLGLPCPCVTPALPIRNEVPVARMVDLNASNAGWSAATTGSSGGR